MASIGTAAGRDVVWRSLQWPGVERLQLEWDATGIVATGLLIARPEGAPVAALYEIHCDAAWRVTCLSIQVLHDAARLDLVRHADGVWEVNEQPAPALRDCIDVDVSLSPFTNTLPIRRLDLAPGQTADLDVAYVTLPDLDVQPARQHYTCRRRDGHGGLFRYESGRFSADLMVDADGLVTTYEDLWERLA
jgi:hypothetical protein